MDIKRTTCTQEELDRLVTIIGISGDGKNSYRDVMNSKLRRQVKTRTRFRQLRECVWEGRKVRQSVDGGTIMRRMNGERIQWQRAGRPYQWEGGKN